MAPRLPCLAVHRLSKQSLVASRSGVQKAPSSSSSANPRNFKRPSSPTDWYRNQLIFGMRSIQGWASGIPTDSEDTLRFAELTGVRPMIEKYPLAKAGEAYARMMSGKAEFRVVLTM